MRSAISLTLDSNDSLFSKKEVDKAMDIEKCIAFLVMLFLSISVCVGYYYFHSPFKFPYKVTEIDISGKRNVDFLDVLDLELITNGLDNYIQHMIYYRYWRNNCERIVQNSFFKSKRKQQFLKCLDEKNIFQFDLIRVTTGYKQIQKSRIPYEKKNVSQSYCVDFSFLQDRYNKLSEINFDSTLSDYYSADQRKRMTKELRAKIAKRDNYTCQMCGRYMPDGFGLEIDHIVPIKKGGKTVESNLQVLCLTCNRKKSSK